MIRGRDQDDNYLTFVLGFPVTKNSQIHYFISYIQAHLYELIQQAPTILYYHLPCASLSWE